MKFLRAVACLYVVAAIVTASGCWGLAYKSGFPIGVWEAITYGLSWPVTWLLGLIFWLAAESR